MSDPAHSHIQSNDELLSGLRNLIDAWCDRRCLSALLLVLPGYFGLNGLTDGWAGLYEALRNVRAFSRDDLPPDELELVNELIRATEKVVYR
jgi:hypothetical protein